MSTQNALAAYSLALAAADALYDNYASYGIRNILTNPETLPRSHCRPGRQTRAVAKKEFRIQEDRIQKPEFPTAPFFILNPDF